MSGAGGPVAVVLAPANRHDSQLLQDVLEAVVVEPPNPVAGPAQHLLEPGVGVGGHRRTGEVMAVQPHRDHLAGVTVQVQVALLRTSATNTTRSTTAIT